ncbi:MAG: hypothetical protein WA485_14465 [Candidatus Sulfotelmatobacter sp.]
MIKKKGKSKKIGTRRPRKRAANTKKKELNPGEVLKSISAMVEAEAEELAGAVIEEGKKGQLPTVKYLFEVAHIYPQPPEGSVPAENEESLAKTLLDRLNIPENPVIHDLYENGEDVMVIPARVAPDTTEKAEKCSVPKEESGTGVE